MFEPRFDPEAMSTEALAAMLQRETDEDTLLMAAEEYARRLEQQGVEIPAAEEAWAEFRTHYMPAKTPELGVAPVKPTRRFSRKGLALVVAAAMLLCCSVLCFYTIATGWLSGLGGDSGQKDAQALLDSYGIVEGAVPIWLPEGYEYAGMEKPADASKAPYIVEYQYGDSMISVTLTPIGNETVPPAGSERYDRGSIEYFIYTNDTFHVAAWVTGGYECSISGQLTTEELKEILDLLHTMQK